MMRDMMLATTGNGTSVHFGMGHMCNRHKQLITLDHIETCDALKDCQDIRKYANKLKDQNILDWDKEERLRGICAFSQLTIQMQKLTAQKEAILVQTQPVQTYIKTGKGPGRPKKITQIAQGNHKINQYFASA